MAFLYRRDLDLLGYDITLRRIRRKRLLSVVAYSELITGDQNIPCMATFFRFTKGVRVDYITDKETEDRLLDIYMLFLRENPKLLFEFVARLLIKGLSSILEIISITYLLYIFTFMECPLSFETFNQIYCMIICFLLSSAVRYLMDVVV